MTMKDLIADIDSRFQSANNVPVERASLRAEEWERIKGVLSGLCLEPCVAVSPKAVCTLPVCHDGFHQANGLTWTIVTVDPPGIMGTNCTYGNPECPQCKPAVTVPEIPTGGTLAETEPVARKTIEDAGLTYGGLMTFEPSPCAVRYIIAHITHDGSWLTGIASNKPLEAGWYRLVCDAEGRQAYEAGPFPSAETALVK